jgi:enoyl-CoA hydratase
MISFARWEQRGHVAVITLDDRERRNALSSEMVEGLLAALSESRTAGARAVLIRGQGSVFCAGADVRGLRSGDWAVAGSPTSPIRVFEALEREERLVVACVRGMALGGGAELVLSCDFAYCAPGASFALPELGLGVIPNTALARLPELIGRRRALELVVTGRRMSAEEAVAMGIVQGVVPGDALEDVGHALLNQVVTRCPPAAIAAVKHATRNHYATDWTEVDASFARIPAAEWETGIDAFVAKDRPDYEPLWQQWAAAGAADS